MIYAYRCRECGQPRDSTTRDDTRPCSCGGLSCRDYSSVQMGVQAFQAHYNYAVGRYVSNRREFEDGLKRGSDHNSEITGMAHDYQPIDPSELKTMTPRTDTAVLEDQARAMHDKRITPVEAGPNAF